LALLARVTATTWLRDGESNPARVDVGSRSRDSEDDAGGGARKCWLSLALVTATTKLARQRVGGGADDGTRPLAR